MAAFHRKLWRHACAGVTCSSLLHCALVVAAMAMWLLGLGVFDVAIATPPMLTVESPRQAADPLELTATYDPVRPPLADDLLDGEALLAAMSDPRWQQLVEPVEISDRAASGVLIVQEIERVSKAAEGRSVDENLSRLADLSQQISSTKAVDDINKQIGQVLQTEERATRPADEPVAGNFDFDTAQLHDVVKHKDEQGNVTYVAILVDAAGRKFESPMGPGDGETAYRTMQLIKTNPLLERVYRGVVMSMMDQVLKGAK